MDVITVVHRYDDDFAIVIRDHLIQVDQPFSAGGGDAGPTPAELFVASLAASAAFQIRRHLTGHGLPAGELEVGARYTMSEDGPERIQRVELSIRLPAQLMEQAERQLATLHAAMQECVVSTSIASAPHVDVDLCVPTEMA